MKFKVILLLFVLTGCEGLKSDIRRLCEDPLTQRGEAICEDHVR